MEKPLSPELYWLVATIILTALIWVPYILNRIIEDGLWSALKNPEPDAQPKAAWAYRAECAHRNAVENLVIFAPLALAVHVAGASTAVTASAAMIYFFTRLAHLIIYIFGIPLLRTLAFAVGFFAQMALALSLLGVL